MLIGSKIGSQPTAQEPKQNAGNVVSPVITASLFPPTLQATGTGSSEPHAVPFKYL